MPITTVDSDPVAKISHTSDPMAANASSAQMGASSGHDCCNNNLSTVMDGCLSGCLVDCGVTCSALVISSIGITELSHPASFGIFRPFYQITYKSLSEPPDTPPPHFHYS